MNLSDIRNIHECYAIPENIVERDSGKDCSTARRAVDVAIYKAGIKEVVEWGNGSCPHAKGRPKRFCEFCWLAQLKVWRMGWQ